LLAGTRLRTWIVITLVTGNLVISTLAGARPQLADPREHVLWNLSIPNPDLEQAVSEHEQKSNNGVALIPRGKRIHGADLPFTDAAVPRWLIPLIVLSGLGLISLVAVLFVRSKAAEEKRYLTELAGTGDIRAASASGAAAEAQAPEVGPSSGEDQLRTEEKEANVGQDQRSMPPEPPPPPPRPGETVEASARESGLLVPLAAWEKVLMQLGNLHQAGQELAQALERAAKAEVEAQFLREQLRELRTERDQLRGLVEGYRERLEKPPPERPRSKLWWLR
jgi:hypothetical protein